MPIPVVDGGEGRHVDLLFGVAVLGVGVGFARRRRELEFKFSEGVGEVVDFFDLDEVGVAFDVVGTRQAHEARGIGTGFIGVVLGGDGRLDASPEARICARSVFGVF